MSEIKPALTNLRGPAARISLVEAESLPAGSEPTVEMTGLDQDRRFKFGIPDGPMSPDAVPTDEAVASWVPNVNTDTGAAIDTAIKLNLARTTAAVRRVEDGVDGVVGGDSVDNTATIQQILDEAGRGGTVVLGNPGPSRRFRIDSTLNVNNWNQRIVGGGPDIYSSSLWTANPILMMDVRAPGVTLEQLSFSTHMTRETATATGVRFLGADTADVDGHIIRCMFHLMDRGVQMHGKNLRVKDTTFSNSKQGIYVGGQIAGYHTAWDSRGLIASDNRFHGMGADSTGGGILISADAVHANAKIQNNKFDMFGLGRDVAVIGATGQRHVNILMSDNQHEHTMNSAYYLDNVERSKVSGSQVFSATATSGAVVTVLNSTSIVLNDLSLYRGEEGIHAASVADLMMRAITVGSMRNDGIRFGAGVSRVQLDAIAAYGNLGWGITGSNALSNPYTGLVSAYLNTAGQINPILGLPA